MCTLNLSIVSGAQRTVKLDINMTKPISKGVMEMVLYIICIASACSKKEPLHRISQLLYMRLEYFKIFLPAALKSQETKSAI